MFDEQPRGCRYHSQHGWLALGFFMYIFDYGDGDVLLRHFRTLWYFYDIFVPFILFFAFYFYHVKIIFIFYMF